MQNRYVADVGDFGKFALLSALTSGDLRLGVVWYLNSAEETNDDGSLTNYQTLRDCDPDLYDRLAGILRGGKRDVGQVRSAGVLPARTEYFNECVPILLRPTFSEGQRNCQWALRQAWFARALNTLAGADLIFLDPDNGLSGQNTRKYQRKVAKYAFMDEVTPWLERSQSVVVYQHQRRQTLVRQISEQRAQLRRYAHSAWALVFRRQSVRIYFILSANEEHSQLLRRRITNFLQSAWGERGHFTDGCGPTKMEL